MDYNVEELGRALSITKSKAEKVAKLRIYMESIAAESTPQLKLSSREDLTNSYHSTLQESTTELMRIVEHHDLMDALKAILGSLQNVENPSRPRVAPLLHILCANQDADDLRFCTHIGSLRCSACQLVAYCSAKCQKTHWARHKAECRDPLRSEKWQPAWVTEGRTPDFVQDGPTNVWTGNTFGIGVILWGNLPAIDILNLSKNEGTQNIRERNFSLAFAASGDLRNLIKTVNALPEDYRGRLEVCLNDHFPVTVMRNILLLLILGLLPDENQAAEYALHLWYSVFISHTYTSDVLPIISKVWEKIISSETIALGPKASLRVDIGEHTHTAFLPVSGKSSLSPGDANVALGNVMLADARVDYRHRYFAGLEPSHRLAMSEWRRFGLVMPFGAVNVHLNIPNPSLFSPDGCFLSYDSANPLEGWAIEEIIASGKKHGASRADIMGCLHFHVKDQLLEFIKRLKRFNIDISVFDRDAIDLAQDIKRKRVALGPFDRIEVSNIVDSNYVGVEDVLTNWGPLLNLQNPHSALIGCFMNWVSDQQGGSAKTLPADQLATLMSKGFRRFRNTLPQHPYDPKMLQMVASLDALHDTSSAFKQYLEKMNAERAAKAGHLSMRNLELTFEQRPGVAIGGRVDELPKFDTEEEWYLHMMLHGVETTPRYVEWVKS